MQVQHKRTPGVFDAQQLTDADLRLPMFQNAAIKRGDWLLASDKRFRVVSQEDFDAQYEPVLQRLRGDPVQVYSVANHVEFALRILRPDIDINTAEFDNITGTMLDLMTKITSSDIFQRRSFTSTDEHEIEEWLKANAGKTVGIHLQLHAGDGPKTLLEHGKHTHAILAQLLKLYSVSGVAPTYQEIEKAEAALMDITNSNGPREYTVQLHLQEAVGMMNPDIKPDTDSFRVLVNQLMGVLVNGKKPAPAKMFDPNFSAGDHANELVAILRPEFERGSKAFHDMVMAIFDFANSGSPHEYTMQFHINNAVAIANPDVKPDSDSFRILVNQLMGVLVNGKKPAPSIWTAEDERKRNKNLLAIDDMAVTDIIEVALNKMSKVTATAKHIEVAHAKLLRIMGVFPTSIEEMRKQAELDLFQAMRWIRIAEHVNYPSVTERAQEKAVMDVAWAIAKYGLRGVERQSGVLSDIEVISMTLNHAHQDSTVDLQYRSADPGLTSTEANYIVTGLRIMNPELDNAHLDKIMFALAPVLELMTKHGFASKETHEGHVIVIYKDHLGLEPAILLSEEEPVPGSVWRFDRDAVRLYPISPVEDDAFTRMTKVKAKLLEIRLNAEQADDTAAGNGSYSGQAHAASIIELVDQIEKELA